MKGFYVGIIGWSNQDDDIVNQYCVAHVHDYSKIATAIMDRLLHKNTFWKFEGKSYRLNEATI